MSRNARSRMGRAIKAAPSFSLDFTKGVLDPRLTFTRASGATYIDSTGVMQLAASGAPRFDYDPVTLAIRGLLIEESRTNLSLTSRSWGVDGTTTAQTQVGVDGVANSAFLVTELLTTAPHRCSGANATFVSGTAYVFAVLVKPGTATRCQLTAASSVTVGYANFSLQGAGSVLASGSVTSAGIRPAGGGFYLCWMVATSGASTTTVGVLAGFIDSDTALRAPSYLGTGLTLILDHAQVEAGAFPTSIIPTSGAAATRAADLLRCIGRDFSTWYQPREGSMLAEVIDGFASVTAQPFCVSDNTVNNRTQLQLGTSLTALYRSNGVNSDLSGNINPPFAGQTFVRCAASYSDRLTIATQGRGFTSSVAAPQPVVTKINFGSNFGDTVTGILWMRYFDYYPVALDPQTLRRITSATEHPSPRRINPDFSLHFLDGVLDSRITFTRASSGTRINSAGVLVTETTNAPRFDYDPITLACKGLLIEEARTNLLLRSDDLNNAVWVALSGTPTKTAGIAAPDGTSNAVRFNFAASGDAISQSVTATITAGNSYTASIYTRNATGSVRLRIARGGGGTFESAEIPTNTSGVWTRVNIPLTFANAQTAVRLDVINQVAGATSVEVFAPQLELGAFATSYIPTTGAAATRASDLAYVDGSNFSSGWFNQLQGTFAVEAITVVDPVAARRLLGVRSDATVNNAWHIMRSTSGGAGARSSIAGVADFNPNTAVGVLTAGVPIKMCSTYARDASPTKTIAAAGSSTVTNATALTTASMIAMDIGVSLTTAQICGHIRHIDYYRQALPPDFITELSK